MIVNEKWGDFRFREIAVRSFFPLNRGEKGN